MVHYAAFLSALGYLAVAVAQLSDPGVQTPPAATQCQTTSIDFTGTQPPFIIAAFLEGQAVSGTALTQIAQTSTSPVAWVVNIAEGTNLQLRIRDNQGRLGYSGTFTVAGSNNASCVGQNTAGVTNTQSATGPIGGGTSSTTTAGGGASTPPASGTTTTPPASSTDGGSDSGSPTSTTTESATTSNAAIAGPALNAGAAGLVGLVGALLFA